MKILTLLIVIILSGCNESIPEDHLLFPGTEVGAAGCYCAFRMKSDLIFKEGRYPVFKELTSMPINDCNHQEHKNRFMVFDGNLYVCNGTSGWENKTQQ